MLMAVRAVSQEPSIIQSLSEKRLQRLQDVLYQTMQKMRDPPGSGFRDKQKDPGQDGAVLLDQARTELKE